MVFFDAKAYLFLRLVFSGFPPYRHANLTRPQWGRGPFHRSQAGRDSSGSKLYVAEFGWLGLPGGHVVRVIDLGFMPVENASALPLIALDGPFSGSNPVNLLDSFSAVSGPRDPQNRSLLAVTGRARPSELGVSVVLEWHGSGGTCWDPVLPCNCFVEPQDPL